MSSFYKLFGESMAQDEGRGEDGIEILRQSLEGDIREESR